MHVFRWIAATPLVGVTCFIPAAAQLPDRKAANTATAPLPGPGKPIYYHAPGYRVLALDLTKCSGTEARTTLWHHDPAKPDDPRRVGDIGTVCDGRPTSFENIYLTYEQVVELVRKRELFTNEGQPVIVSGPISYVPLELRVAFNALSAGASKGPAISAAAKAKTHTASSALSDRIALAITDSFARTPRLSLARGIGVARVQKNQIIANILVTSVVYTFSARNAQCTVGAPLRCTYEFQMAIGSSAMMRPASAVSTGWIRRRDEFVDQNGMLRSASLDADMVKATAEDGARATGPVSPTDTYDYSMPDFSGTMCRMGSESYC